MTDQFANQDVTSDDKLWALLTYVLSPIVPIIILLMDDKKNRPYLKAHNAQALVMGIIIAILSILIGWTIILGCIPFLVWLVMVYWGVQAYQGKYVTIPVVTDWCKKQGWA
ncbi:MAG: hypothetical protein A2029_14580 [Chloroflexi bacterium RBG_19FT_COMBO_47_9]|jgi:uncharacterized membrane protein|nr:MAG: hypothetical protein A2029_14580 [Chloroflexi bacterium RBG_19FT_COMBO_47_9]